MNFPGYYLRHAGYTCQLNAVDGSQLFNMDASFIPIHAEPTVVYTEENCRLAAIAAGLEIGGAGYPFAGDWGVKGCYAYDSTSADYAGMAYYGLGGTEAEM